MYVYIVLCISRQTLDGTWGVSVLDHGGLIVAAKDYHNGIVESRTLMYTCNEGSSWSQLTFTNENLRVYGVITEPGETTTVVRLVNQAIHYK